MRGGRLQEVPNNCSDTLGILENWSLRRGGHLRELVAPGGLTICATKLTHPELPPIKYVHLCMIGVNFGWLTTI